MPLSITRQPSWSGPTDLVDRHPHIGEEHLVRAEDVAGQGGDLPQFDALGRRVDEDRGDALVLLAGRRVGAHVGEDLRARQARRRCTTSSDR